jgi:hypothetical protein
MGNSVRFHELYNRSGGGTVRDYALRVVYINPEHVVYLREDDRAMNLLSEGYLPEGLDSRQQFTKISLNGGTSGHEMTVVGPIHDVHQKLDSASKSLLKG